MSTPVFPRSLYAACLVLSATGTNAETFAVKLGKTSLGQLTYTSEAEGASLTSTLSNTPLGVFNGTFNGTSRNAGQVQSFVGISNSSRKSREVHVQMTNGTPTSTRIIPAAEETTLSDPTAAPVNVTDPVQAIGKLLNATGCPKRINIYDGRRAIALIPRASEQADGLLICTITYKVTAGPGHLSPLKISKAKMQVTYKTQDTSQALHQIQLGSGIFNLTLERAN